MTPRATPQLLDRGLGHRLGLTSSLTLVLALSLAMWGCESSGASDSGGGAAEPAGTAVESTGSETGGLGGEGGTESDSGMSAPGSSSDPSAAPGEPGGSSGGEGGEPGGEPAAEPETSEGPGEDVAEPEDPITDPEAEPEPVDPELQSGTLTAGEWRDLDHWDFWLGLIDESEGAGGAFAAFDEPWELFTHMRVPVRVTHDGQPAVDALVQLTASSPELVYEARTNNLGLAELYVGLRGQTVTGTLDLHASSGEGVVFVENIQPTLDGTRLELELDAAPESPANILDLMFVVDTTGSMGDELDWLITELDDVIEQVAANNGQDLQIRLSLNFYKDQGDAYVVNDSPFTTDIVQQLEFLSKESAGGGGDFPEAVSEALENAIFEHEWSPSARARMVFLILDAPPHGGDAHVQRVGEATVGAAAEGIRIFPVVASGIDKNTEALMRMIEVATGASYIFLTDDSGVGDSHIEPTIGSYEVELLRNLLVRVIGEHLVDPFAGLPGGDESEVEE